MNQVPSKPIAAKTMKVNPSATLIGMKLESSSPVSVNVRKGKTNVVTCNQIEVKAANNTGRRLTLTFSLNGTQVSERRVYKEWFEKMADQFGVDLP